MAAIQAIKKLTFTWDGLSKRGVKISGESQAINENLLKATLRRQGIHPLKVRQKRMASGGKAIKPIDIAYFARQLTTMLRSGVPLVQSLDLISSGHEKPKMQLLINHILADIEGGSTLSTALGRQPKHFDELFCSLVEAGEQSGALETMLEKIATYKEKTESLKAKVKKALFYPIAILVVATVITVIMLIYVIPEFKALFEGFGADLPAFTQMVIDLSEFLQESWWMVLFPMIGAGFAFNILKKRSKKFNRILDQLVLKLPIMGEIIDKSSIARFSRTLSTMFAAGVPLVEAMDSVAGSTGNILYREATLKMRDDASQGIQLNQAMQTTKIFPNMVVQMTKIGEESGNMEEMLNKVADYYEEQVDNLVDSLTSLMEPLIMAVLGVVIGGLVIAMYLPIFKMGSAI